MNTMQWRVRFPHFVDIEPRQKSDIVARDFADHTLFDSHDLYATEADAWQAARGYLQAERAQCLADLAFLSEPYTSQMGTRYTCTAAQLQQWRKEIFGRLRIADTGLELSAR